MDTPCFNQTPWVHPKDARVRHFYDWRYVAARKRLWKRLYSLARHQQFSISSATDGRAFVLLKGDWSCSFSADYEGLMDASTLLESVCEM